MGYLCPVCETPFGDGQSLADHLAVTAILHGGAHETWLSDTIADWEDADRVTVADRVVEYAEEVDADHPSDADHSVPLRPSEMETPISASAGMTAELGGLDAEAKSILQEAQAFTQAMHGDGETDAKRDTDASNERNNGN